MTEMSDYYIAIPGGYGTLEELFEVITWQQLGIHNKPIGLLNVDGFYDNLVNFIQHCSVEGFIHEKFTQILVVKNDPLSLLDALLNHKPPCGSLWLKPEET